MKVIFYSINCDNIQGVYYGKRDLINFQVTQINSDTLVNNKRYLP